MTKEVMTYHTLVDRESQNVGQKWRTSIIVILFVISICGFVAAFNLNYLLDNYNHHCVFSANVEFKHVPLESGKLSLNEVLSSSVPPIDGNGIDTAEEIEQFTKKAQHLQDEIIFNTTLIDDVYTEWGQPSQCDLIRIIPFFGSFVSIVWIVMFFTYGYAGSSKTFIPKSWRIVLPATVFFFLMMIISTFFLFYTKAKMRNFCTQLQEPLSTTYSCAELLDRFRLNTDMLPTAGRNYTTTLILLILITLLWITGFIVMVLRCIFVPDFKLVKVTVTKDVGDDTKGKKTVQIPEKYFVKNERHDIAAYNDGDDSESDDETSFTTAPNVTPDKI